jgi:DNA-directed RNA polymerase subunit H (RpoH/RPB5)
MSGDRKWEATVLVNEDELAKINIEDESVSSQGSSDHGKIIRLLRDLNFNFP